ncbi:hypothetical protein HOD08_03800, partial [bacterium]|nr:hypothetical protein [bacterium]
YVGPHYKKAIADKWNPIPEPTKPAEPAGPTESQKVSALIQEMIPILEGFDGEGLTKEQINGLMQQMITAIENQLANVKFADSIKESVQGTANYIKSSDPNSLEVTAFTEKIIGDLSALADAAKEL